MVCKDRTVPEHLPFPSGIPSSFQVTNTYPSPLIVGQALYFANTTNHQEALPVTVDILAAKGCDLMIAQLAQDLVTAGIIQAPLTGGTIYGGDILLKRDAEEMGMKMRYVG